MSLFQTGDFTLHSGQRSQFLIDCDALTDDSLAALADYAARELLPAFGEVVGIPNGGLRFAEALRRYAVDGSTLIVDDVCTTGASFAQHHGFDHIGVCIVARSRACPSWVTPLFRLTPGGAS